MRHFRQGLPAVLIATAVALSALPAQGASDKSPSDGLRLFSPSHHPVLTVHNTGEDTWIEFNPSMYLGSRSSRLEIDVHRQDASKPITAVVHVDGKTRNLPRRTLNGWNGLKKAFTLTWTDSSGKKISSSKVDWCPNDGQAGRLGPHAASETAFAYGCSSNPFTRGQRWGVDKGWSRQVLAYGINVPDPEKLSGHVTLKVTLRWAVAKAFGLSKSERSLSFDVPVKHVTDDEGPGPVGKVAVKSAAGASAQNPSAPRSDRAGSLQRALLPDLISLPAWGISTHHEDGRDLLDFAATVYNGGRGPLVAEGFRRGSQELMDAYQFFYRDDKQVASRKVGTMEYDSRPSHQHWHFKDFAVYDLVNAQHKRLATSGKEAFCLAPTDAINLLQPGAVVNPGNGDLSTACGDISTVWVREVLAAGWGDTYTQQRAGQSIDVTGLANGTYWIRVTANPIHRLHEATSKNNVSMRRVILGGTAGHRTVKVPNYGLINSEAGLTGPDQDPPPMGG